VSLAGVRVESLVPADLDDRAAVPTDSFLARLADHDAAMAERQRLAAADGRVLRMIGEVDLSDPAKPVASVALAAVEPSHPFAGLAGSDNVVAVSTERYSAAPLVIRGAGAGAEVTAHGVFRDVIEVSRTIRL
jgi:homoserine dehydrogenase